MPLLLFGLGWGAEDAWVSRTSIPMEASGPTPLLWQAVSGEQGLELRVPPLTGVPSRPCICCGLWRTPRFSDLCSFPCSPDTFISRLKGQGVAECSHHTRSIRGVVWQVQKGQMLT